jgi:hypothetical protein
MDLFTEILAPGLPPGTQLDAWEPSFRGLPNYWVLAILLFLIVFGGVAIVFFNIKEKGTLGPIRRILLMGLRGSLLLVLLFLIMRPILLAEFVSEHPVGVALLIDNTQSMQLRDRRLTEADKARVAVAKGLLPLETNVADKTLKLPAETPSDPPRVDLVKAVLGNSELNLVSDLQKFGPLRAYLFGTEVRGAEDDGKKTQLADRIIAGYKAEDARTALADSIVKVVQSRDSEPPAAIVIFTDGQDNASKYTLQEAAQLCKAKDKQGRERKIPLHIYGVGSSEGAQLQLKEVGAPDTLFVDDSVSIPLRWRAQGFKQGEVDVSIKLGGKVVLEKKLKLQTGEDLREIVNFVVPKDPEKREDQELVTTIKYKTGRGEPFTDTITRTVRVADSKIRVLYIENLPRWEYKFLQPALSRDRRIEVDYLLISADPKATRTFDEKSPLLGEFPKTRDKFLEAKYNLILMGDVPSTYFSKEQLEWISEFVKNRGGLIVMAGRQNMPNTYEGTPIADLLPIEFKKQKFSLDADVRTQEYPPTLTEAGQRTDWLALADTPEENLEVWQKKLQGFHWNFPVTKVKPAAQSLVVNPRLKIGEPPAPMPILATHFFGKGQVVWLGTDETWRWRWNFEDKYFVRFWGQLIYQIGLPSLLGDSAKRASMALDRSQAVVGRPNTIYVRLWDKEFNPRKDLKVDAELVYVDAKAGEERKTPVMLNAIAGRPGEYALVVPNNRAGRYELNVKNPEANTFGFRVDLPPRHELEEAGLNEKALREAAEITGGRFYREEDLHNLSSNIVMEKAQTRHHQEVVLWTWPAILIFLGLITMEWLVRKFSDLS